MAANSSVPKSTACLHSYCALIYLCCFPADLFHVLFMVFSCSSTSLLFNSSFSSAPFCLLFTIPISSQFVSIPAPFCPCKPPHYCAPTVVQGLGTTWGDFCSPVCAQPSINSRTGPDRNLCCTQEGWSLGTKVRLPLPALLAGKNVK